MAAPAGRPRLPDHSIWSHLDVTAALAGAFAGGDGPALLAVSFAPVQPFIEQARSVSDLWAGSHLLARIAWEGIKVVAERFGPDCVLYPQLRGIAEVDRWLRDEVGLAAELFRDGDRSKRSSEGNPLRAAALPNRFIAIVPDEAAATIGDAITGAVRRFVAEEAHRAIAQVLEVIGEPPGRDDRPCFRQIDAQLAGFPEVHWAMVPWSLATNDDTGATDDRLKAALAAFHPVADTTAPGFFASTAYRVLTRPTQSGEHAFFEPNPGFLYPPLYDLADRTLAAAKSLRAFDPLEQAGYRAALGGEREWLTLDRDQLFMNRRKRREAETLWIRVAEKRPNWAAKDEHLDALGTLKRLWPKRVRGAGGEAVRRHVLSTRTLALAPLLERLAAAPLPAGGDFAAKVNRHQGEAVLPRKLQAMLAGEPEKARFLRRLVDYRDALADEAGEDPARAARAEAEERGLRGLLGDITPFPYYAILRLDGDNMGAWLSGSHGALETSCADAFHPDVRAAAERLTAADPGLRDYLAAPRAPSPGRHTAISAALSAFALRLVRPIVEECCKGQLIYAGGDDVLAMVAVDDLLPSMALLRLAYSGIVPGGSKDEIWQDFLAPVLGPDRHLSEGFVRWGDSLLRVMGRKATASVGVVLAHEKEPLARVLREVRSAEKRAKALPGKNAFAITLLKRSGGPIELTQPWWPGDAGAACLAASPIGMLFRLRALFADRGFSRRALYHVLGWLNRLPSPETFADTPALKPRAHAAYQEMIERTLVEQMRRQASDDATERAAKAAAVGLVKTAAAVSAATGQAVAGGIAAMLATAEFLARPLRDLAAADKGEPSRPAAE